MAYRAMDQQACAPGMSHPTSSGDQADLIAITPKADNANICARCRDIPWIDGPLGEETMLIQWPASETCSICCQLLRCEPKYWEVVMLMWKQGGARDLKCESTLNSKRAWTVNRVLLRVLSRHDRRHHDYTIDICSADDEAARNKYYHLDLPEARASFSQIKENISLCMERHKASCNPGMGRKLTDLRVIDCERRLLADAPTKCNYVALSYVWGDSSDSQDFILSHSLPPTIEHAILTTLELGYKYLWVDRYCIDQQNSKDRDTQILQMSLIYQKAQLTVFAAAGDNPSYGLPGVQSRRKFRSPARHAQVGSLYLSTTPSPITMADRCLAEIAGSKWASRAWTYQEAAFSQRRCLLFTDREVLFSCNAMTCLETGSTLRNQDLSGLKALWDLSASISEGEVIHRITTSMEQYCGRYLTKDSDALNAILSTLETLVEKDYYHLWGVPVRCHSLDHNNCETSHSEMQCASNSSGSEAPRMVDIWLSWVHDDSPSRKRISRRRLDFPSWSPLGWAEAPIHWEELSPFTGVVSFRTPPFSKPISDYLQSVERDLNQMPQLLHLRFKTAQVQILSSECPNSLSQPGEDGCILFSLGEGYHLTEFASWDVDPNMYSGPAKAVIVSEDAEELDFLVLKDFTSHYERVGSGTMSKAPLNGHSHSPYIWHKQDDLSFIRMYTGSRHWKADKERLAASFGDLDTYEWWSDIFKEECITLG